MDDWQTAKSKLNHAWLGNTLLNRSAVWKDRPPKYDEFYEVESILNEWRRVHPSVRILIESFETEESPKGLFEYHPLASLPESDKVWLAAVAHLCWMDRLNVHQAVKNALQGYDECCERFDSLVSSFSAFKEELSESEHLRNGSGHRASIGDHFTLEIADFRNAIRALSSSISVFPYDARNL